LLVHVCWEQLQTWTRDRDNLPSVLPSLLPGLWAIHCPVLRAHFLALLWRTFMDKLLQDTARLTETMAKTVVNRSAKCMEVCQFSAENAGAVLGLMASLLDCQLQTLALLGEHPALPIQYDELCKDSRPHLLEHVQATKIPDIELVSLQHQLATVLELSWTLKVDLRPLHIFNSMEAGQLLQTQPGMFSSLFVDHNASVNRARVSWVEVVVEAAVGHIHLRPGEGRVYDTETFQQFCTKLYQVSKVWFLSDLVRTCQVEHLYRAGYDDLGLELKGGVTDVQRLASRLLEVGLLRLAKHVWTGDNQGRLAAVPPALLSHLAERKEASNSVAEAGLVDTVALLAWTANTLEDEDRHNLATSALAAGQVLTVRNNRNS